MNIEVKASWIKALRSGEYKQGFKTLHSSDGCFCALGVLCDVYAKQFGYEWEDNYSVTTPSGTMVVFSLKHVLSNNDVVYSYSVPQRPISEWAGVTENPWIHATTPEGVRGTFLVSELNDKFKLSFAEIATLIEEQL